MFLAIIYIVYEGKQQDSLNSQKVENFVRLFTRSIRPYFDQWLGDLSSSHSNFDIFISVDNLGFFRK